MYCLCTAFCANVLFLSPAAAATATATAAVVVVVAVARSLPHFSKKIKFQTKRKKRQKSQKQAQTFGKVLETEVDFTCRCFRPLSTVLVIAVAVDAAAAASAVVVSLFGLCWRCRCFRYCRPLFSKNRLTFFHSRL